MKETPSTNKSPPNSDPRIDALIRGYTRLSEQVEALTEQIEKQQYQAEKQKANLTVDSILADLHQKQKLPSSAADLQGRASPEPTKEETDSSPAVREEASPPKQKRKEPVQARAPAKREKLQKREEEEEPSRKKRFFKTAGTILFYCSLVFLVVSALFIRATSSSPRSLAGFTGMIVLSGSMQSEIPQGSLVIAQQVDPETLQIGDDITFMANQTTTVTHRIIGIIEDYEGTGQRAFETQGVMNARPDAQPVPAVNVVGKVIWHSLIMGQIASFIGEYWMFLLFVLVVIIGLAIALKHIYKKEPKQASRH